MKPSSIRSSAFRVIVLAIFALCTSRYAAADGVLYSQPAQSPVTTVGGLDQYMGSFAVADTFSLSQGGTLDAIQWQGSYTDSTTAFPVADATSFLLYLAACSTADCSSGSSFVDGFPYPTMVTPSMANETFIGNSTPLIDGIISVPGSNYTYQYNLPSPAHLSSGFYQLSIFANLPESNNNTAWSWDAGTGGDGKSVKFYGDGTNDFDLAFTLSGTQDTATAPEPSSVLLFGLGLGALIAFARKVPLQASQTKLS